MKIFLTFLSSLVFLQQSLYAHPNEWMSYVSNTPIANYQASVLVETQQQAIVTSIRPAPVIVYNWVPIYINQPVVYEKYGIFCKQRIVVQQPVIYWVYTPIGY